MKKEWSGERLETFIWNETTLEHLHRYAIALSLAKDKNVLDIACGEGYGSSLLAGVARHVTGIDIDVHTVNEAKDKYKAANLVFKQGDVLEIEGYGPFDLIVCFETLEHVEQHQKLIDRFKAMMHGESLLLISTPDRTSYSDVTGYKNQFHQKELYEEEFKVLLESNFNFVSFYKQNFVRGSLIVPDKLPCLGNSYTGDFTSITQKKNLPQYWLAIAAQKKQDVPEGSIFQNQTIMEKADREAQEAILRSLTYRMGHFVLSPLKWLRNRLK